MDAIYLKKLGDYDLEELQEAWFAARGPEPMSIPSVHTLGVDLPKNDLLRAA